MEFYKTGDANADPLRAVAAELSGVGDSFSPPAGGRLLCRATPGTELAVRYLKAAAFRPAACSLDRLTLPAHLLRGLS